MNSDEDDSIQIMDGVTVKITTEALPDPKKK